MISAQLDAITAKLESMKTSHNIQTIDIWSGDTTTLTEQAKRLPALFVLYQSSRFKPNKTGTGITDIIAERTFKVLVVDKQFDPKARSNNVKKSCSVLQEVMMLLTNYEVTPSCYLWPADERLILAEKGTFVYAISFSLEESHRAAV